MKKVTFYIYYVVTNKRLYHLFIKHQNIYYHNIKYQLLLHANTIHILIFIHNY